MQDIGRKRSSDCKQLLNINKPSKVLFNTTKAQKVSFADIFSGGFCLMNPVTAFPQSLCAGGEGRQKHAGGRKSPLPFVSGAPRRAVTPGALRSAHRLVQETGRKQPTPSPHSRGVCPTYRTNGSDGCSLLIMGKMANGPLPAVLLSSLSGSPPKPAQRSHVAITRSHPLRYLPSSMARWEGGEHHPRAPGCFGVERYHAERGVSTGLALFGVGMT